LIKEGGQYSTQEALLGFDFDGLTKTMWLESVKRRKLLTILKVPDTFGHAGHSRCTI
jgi:hypothetical protein